MIQLWHNISSRQVANLGYNTTVTDDLLTACTVGRFVTCSMGTADAHTFCGTFCKTRNFATHDTCCSRQQRSIWRMLTLGCQSCCIHHEWCTTYCRTSTCINTFRVNYSTNATVLSPTTWSIWCTRTEKPSRLRSRAAPRTAPRSKINYE